MTILVIGNKDRYIKYMPKLDIVKKTNVIYCPMGTSDNEMLAVAANVECILADAIATVSKYLIEKMPNLKMIHSEGVAYNKIDLQAAKEKGIFVCNNKGVNAGAVAEQCVLLMLALLRSTLKGDRTVREGNQIQIKEKLMVEGITELSDCKVGLIGFGDIAKATAKRLFAFECEMYYYSRNRMTKEIEEEYHVSYMDLDQLAQSCDIISIHVPVTQETTGMINKSFLSKMKKTAYIINTARGEIVNNYDMREALISGSIKGAGFDTIYPEPTTKDNILVDLPQESADKVIYSPHIAGITTSTFYRAHLNLWKNVENIFNHVRPENIVNGL